MLLDVIKEEHSSVVQQEVSFFVRTSHATRNGTLWTALCTDFEIITE